MTLMDQIQENKKMDSRKNFADFYNTFNLDSLFSKPMADFILNGKRKAKNHQLVMSFLSKCITIYREHTKDYVHCSTSVHDLYENYNVTHEVGIIPERLQAATGREMAVVKRAINNNPKSINNQATNDVRDTLSYDLINSKYSVDNIFNNVIAYKELDRRLMRAQIGDGTNIKTIYDVSQKTGISIDVLEGLSQACRHKDDYLDVYQKLIELSIPYQLN
ncbi:MAG TPA: hypothetical protein H9820_03815 [Candidatus Companilactobacillus pullicola]|uniref:Uncharacterized protein n=1 Tax=Candidatus Companilactobacillus pullicola TaxID=2838523 RepID=A0A9D2CN58_9LACO|nr:hypothetical protein [Candidatus Companilactobacillus pullicola]